MKSLALFRNWEDLTRFGNESFETKFSREIIREKDRYMIRIHVPGMKRKHLKINISDGKLIVEGYRVQKSNSWLGHRYSETCESFCESFLLYEEMDTDQIKAKLRNGWLKITIPVKKEFSKSHEIMIEDAEVVEKPRWFERLKQKINSVTKTKK